MLLCILFCGKNGIHKGVLALKTSFHGEFTSTLLKWASFIVKPSFALKINVAKSAESRRKIRVFELTTFLLKSYAVCGAFPRTNFGARTVSRSGGRLFFYCRTNQTNCLREKCRITSRSFSDYDTFSFLRPFMERITQPFRSRRCDDPMLH